MINNLILRNLIGGLTTTGASGKAELNLAKKLDVDPRGLDWVFELRSEMTCEDGTTIDAAAFVANLKRQLLAYSKIASNASVLNFDDLSGIQDFLAGKTGNLIGLQAISKLKVRFRFVRRPDDELMDMLGEPYFGYWCPDNFVESRFKNSDHFISSGSYSLESVSSDHAVLRMRHDWHRANPRAPQEVEIRALGSATHVGQDVLTIVEAGVEPPAFDDLKNFRAVPGAPAWLTALKVSPFAPSGFFKDVAARRLFRQKIETSDLSAKLPKDGILASNLFFAGAPSTKNLPVKMPEKFKTVEKPIKVCLSHSFSDRVNESVKSVISSILVPTGQRLEFEYVDRTRPHWREELHSGVTYDVQIANVVIGGFFNNPQIEMMFCSRLGVSFWDVSGRICAQAKSFEGKRTVDQKYVDNFNQILQEDSTVIPLFHSGIVYLYTKDFDLQSVTTQSANYPPFDTLRLTE